MVWNRVNLQQFVNRDLQGFVEKLHRRFPYTGISMPQLPGMLPREPCP